MPPSAMPPRLTPASGHAPLRAAPAGPVRALFLGSGFAGHRTRFTNLQGHLRADPQLDADWHIVSGWQPGRLLERIRVLPRSVRGRLRATLEGARVARLPRPDVIWTAAGADLAPHLWAQTGPLRRPMVLDLDWTVDLREALAPHYLGRPPRTGLALEASRLRERAVWRATTVFTPWSEWAADALRARGVAESRIRVIPPGVDLQWWRPPAAHPRPPRSAQEPLRLLFVGGDFRRKGGDLLLALLGGPLAGVCELDIVTREDVTPAPGVRVHRAEPNTPTLLNLYHDADLFVMPSRAECFGLATIEAMAAGLPVVVSDVGAAREIVADGETGWVVPPERAALAQRLRAAALDRDALRQAGRAGRARAEARFDGARNDRAVGDLVVALGRMWTTSRR